MLNLMPNISVRQTDKQVSSAGLRFDTNLWKEMFKQDVIGDQYFSKISRYFSLAIDFFEMH